MEKKKRALYGFLERCYIYLICETCGYIYIYIIYNIDISNSISYIYMQCLTLLGGLECGGKGSIGVLLLMASILHQWICG